MGKDIDHEKLMDDLRKDVERNQENLDKGGRNK